MRKQKSQLVIRYVSYPKPQVYVYSIIKEKGVYKIQNSINEYLHEYQINDVGKITDDKVLATKIKEQLGDNVTKDGIIFLYDSLDLIHFNTVLPKMKINKAKAIAKKELSEFFKVSKENHETMRIVKSRDGSIIVYFDLIDKNFIYGLEGLANAMDKYVDTAVSYIQAIASYIEDKVDDIINSFVVYKDNHYIVVMLLLESKLIDSIVLYYGDDIDKVYSDIEVIRNKHYYAFEKIETNEIIIFSEDIEYKNNATKTLEDKYKFQVKNFEGINADIIIHAVDNAMEYSEGYIVKV